MPRSGVVRRGPPSIATMTDLARLDDVTPLVTMLREAPRRAVSRFVYLSSGGTVYGNPQTLPIPESHPLQPISGWW